VNEARLLAHTPVSPPNSPADGYSRFTARGSGAPPSVIRRPQQYAKVIKRVAERCIACMPPKRLHTCGEVKRSGTLHPISMCHRGIEWHTRDTGRGACIEPSMGDGKEEEWHTVIQGRSHRRQAVNICGMFSRHGVLGGKRMVWHRAQSCTKNGTEGTSGLCGTRSAAICEENQVRTTSHVSQRARRCRKPRFSSRWSSRYPRA